MVRYLDPAAVLACRTPLMEHFNSADGKAAGILTLLGMMFTILARTGSTVGTFLTAGGLAKFAALSLLIAFTAVALATVLQIFRTISPRFPKAPPSLMFWGDIIRLSREDYKAQVQSMTPEQALEQLLNYNHTTSTICSEKFKQLKRGMKCFQIAAMTWGVLMAVVSYRMFHG